MTKTGVVSVSRCLTQREIIAGRFDVFEYEHIKLCQLLYGDIADILDDHRAYYVQYLPEQTWPSGEFDELVYLQISCLVLLYHAIDAEIGEAVRLDAFPPVQYATEMRYMVADFERRFRLERYPLSDSETVSAWVRIA